MLARSLPLFLPLVAMILRRTPSMLMGSNCPRPPHAVQRRLAPALKRSWTVFSPLQRPQGWVGTAGAALSEQMPVISYPLVFRGWDAAAYSRVSARWCKICNMHKTCQTKNNIAKTDAPACLAANQGIGLLKVNFLVTICPVIAASVSIILPTLATAAVTDSARSGRLTVRRSRDEATRSCAAATGDGNFLGALHPILGSLGKLVLSQVRLDQTIELGGILTVGTPTRVAVLLAKRRYRNTDDRAFHDIIFHATEDGSGIFEVAPKRRAGVSPRREAW